MANRIQIQTALQKPYDRILFGKEVLSPVFGSCFNLTSSAVPASMQPNKSEQAVIQSVSIYGTINLEDKTEITCYEINLQPSVRIEHSKVAIQRYVRKLLTAGQIALVNFIAPKNKKVWRLTLVAKDSELTEQGIKEKTTHAKRYTYLLGPSETCKTAAERFESLSTEKQITFQALVNAFSVEKLSKAFFDEYTLHYQKFCDYLQESDFRKSVFKITIHTNATKEVKDKACKPIRDFVKKLLGRIVFLYFVQKKGWVGASDTQYKDGLTDFIKQLFKQSGGNDAFYSTWLTVLFFETLNKERSNDDFKMPDGKKVKVPFLNGGLFDKEDHDEHILTFKSKLFHHPDFEDTLLTEKNKDNARGFLDFLDAFNFTVHEDSPDDHTVAVDPEMLGHIFENLLEDNKDKGAFYTPKEIVHYMCQESLTEYLTTHLSKEYTVYKEIGNAQVELFGNETKTGQLKLMEQLGDKALNRDDVAYIVKYKDISKLQPKQLKRIDALLDTVKICDPAIGSGAFPMGLLQEIHAIKEVIAYELQQTWKPADVKENIIQNSVYGVDIEKGAVDIARLRFWLSLVVDEEKPRALPNLDYKIVVGDSLVSKFEGEIIEIDWERKTSVGKADTFVQNIQRLLKEIAEKQKKFFKPDNKDKKKLQAEIRNLKLELLINQLSFNKEVYVSKNKIVLDSGLGLTAKEKSKNLEVEQKVIEYKRVIGKLQKLKQNKEEPFEHFDWKLDFPEILNPYLVNGNAGFDIVIGNPPYVKEATNRNAFEGLKSHPIYQGKMDLWYFFGHLALNISRKENGLACLIATNNWITNDGASKFRNYVIKNSTIQKFDDFGDFKIFVSAGIQTMIGIFKNSDEKTYSLEYSRLNNSKINRPQLIEFLNSEYNVQSNDWTKRITKFDSLKFIDSYITFVTSGVIDELASKGTFFLADEEIYSGIDVLQDFVAKSHLLKLSHLNIKIGDGIFVLSSNELKSLNFNSEELKKIKPYFTTNEINKYCTIENNEFYIIYSDREVFESIDNYPNIKKHLSKFKSVMTSVNAPYGLHRSRNEQIFKGEKILSIRKCAEPSFTYTWFDTYVSRAFLIIKSNRISLKFATSILNSTLIKFWLTIKGKMQGNNYQIDKEPLKTVPFVIPNNANQFERFVDYIIYLRSHQLIQPSDQLMPTYFEQIIDGMVYELYFPELIKKYKREIIQHLGELPEFTDKMSDEQKMKICKTVFNRFNEREHLVRVNLFYMNSIPEIAIIEGKNENN